MSTENQIKANQENSQHSTGPKTEEGKAVSSQNSRTHGLSSAHLYIPEDQKDEFQALYDTYWNDLRPIGEIQLEYFERIVHAKWNANIARTLHMAALNSGDEKRIHTATRYLHQWERSYDKSLKMLRDDQSDLALRAIPQNEAISGLAMTCSIAKVTAAATKIARMQERTQWPTARQAILEAIGRAFRPELTSPPAEPEPAPPQPAA
jgi:hypothetical protein